MARTGLLDHGAALGDTVRYDMRDPIKSGQQRNRHLIKPGKCGFRGCTENRIGGVWAAGGSYMCHAHKLLMMPMRLKRGMGLKQREAQKRLEEMDSQD